MNNPALYCPECGVYFTEHFRESPTCSFTLHDEMVDGFHEFGWMPKDQSPRGIHESDPPAFTLYMQ
jgi:hypothetical protein